ncbi:MAG: PDDEXK nuclease domain-containing protein [Chloroflexi bacterium]|nr:PDDEXK nuclease domain-containing protein [Chloroflexota bacterium]
MNFDALVQAIADIHCQTQSTAVKAVNVALTLRNWLIGTYIVEFEQRGEDRAAYGEKLLPTLAERLKAYSLPRTDERELRRYRTLYLAYPKIRESLTPEFAGRFLPLVAGIREAATPESAHRPKKGAARGKALLPVATSSEPSGGEIFQAATGQSGLSGRLLVERLSYTHLEQLIQIGDPLKRAFYEVECVKGGWSVRELRRQIGSLYFERSGLSRDKEALSRLANADAEAQTPALAIRDPYVFEFLGLRPQEVLPESALEAALLAKLEAFLLELGHGFCLEARQKRLLIGEEAFFVDLVFYHRVLKCHVLVELKVDAFSHEHLGQLNTYVSYYRANEMTPGDQPPVGILLCTGKNHALVEYALAGLDNRLFVSKYQLELPKPEDLQRYIDEQRRLLEEGDT